ncbi:DUF6600 domain-containing protein [Prosthecobacter sp.]|uniref:DUF6600 domain-containing protein n=1 Tax=Prosthecobacter sp. TaxID=1965333 RepID=UPI002AB9ADB8|nr:DUF6600 domain-containing protein [Prosthecobacter sp.]MDZ4405413.1 DUF6600 domain-containing protein [Prosthecobacter sp.]
MKHLSFLLCAALFAVATPVPTARADVGISIDFFYDALDSYGDWIYTRNYGYVWEPRASRNAYWSPYSDGYWAYTNAGWTWISNEDFGWATYHYGRWLRMFGRWVWVPGYEWAPAWVSWRQTDDYIGWAPLPPEARWNISIGFNWWTDSYYDVGPAYYSFVPIRSFATRSSLRPFIVDRSRNFTFIDRSVNITNITYQQNVVNNIFVGGPDPTRIDRLGENRVRRLTLRRDEDSFRRDWIDNQNARHGGFRSLSRIENDQLVVAAPTVKKEETRALPPRVRERFDRPEIDRGWSGLSDSNAAERLRARQREELAKAKAEKLPEKTPLVATSDVPPPAVGRALQPQERWGTAQRPDPRRVDDEVRKAQPLSPEGKPGVKEDPPAPGEARRPSMPGRADRPGLGPDSRPDLRPDGRPGRGPDGRPDSDDRPSGIKPGEGSKPQLVPGKPGTETSPKADGKPATPKLVPEPNLTPPKVRPDLPGNRDGRLDFGPGGRRPLAPDSPPPSPPKARPVPMPEPQSEPKARPPSPMPRPEAPSVKPAPMPQPVQPPQVRPPEIQRRPDVPEKAREEKRAETPQFRPFQPQARPMPQPPLAAPQPSPQGQETPPQLRPPPPARQAPSPPPAPQPAAPQEKKPEERRQR